MANRYWDILGHYDAETQAFSACVGAVAPSPFTPNANGKLVGIRIVVGSEAATTLSNALIFRLSSASFSPVNTVQIMGMGNGLQTVPAAARPTFDFDCNLDVKVGTKITVEGRNVQATAVTVDAYVLGLFES
jgi:hypothetical protein